jgi:hypothetical protein
MNNRGPHILKNNRIRVVVVTTVMLTFISYWRAAAIVLSDLASSAYYIVGIAERAIGKSAPWYILGVMLFSYAVRLLYIESSAMFTRGGVYKVVKQAMGGGIAKLAVSALLFDFMLTGPISAVSAGQYIAGLINSIFIQTGIPIVLPANTSAAVFAIGITLYFWRQNILGIEESSDKALKIMKITAVMAVTMIVWSITTLCVRGFQIPPFDFHVREDAMGWLKDVEWAKTIGFVGIMIAFGHSILAMSGEETLAQVYREIESPKLRNLQKAGVVIFAFSMIFTSLISFFAIMIVPDELRVTVFKDNAISGLAMYVIGPIWIRLAMQAFVVVVGFLILAGAVNTAIIGSNGVLNRLAEDDVLTDWFRHPHRKYGTTSRIVNWIVGLQIMVIIVSQGDIFVLGEAYAFGLVWSFVMNALSTLILRFKDRSPREFKVPLNFTIKGREIPFGISLIFLILFFVAITNLFTKPVATEWGIGFTIFLFIVFFSSEMVNRRHARKSQTHLEKFNIFGESTITPESIGSSRKERKLVAVGSITNLKHLSKCLEETDTDNVDIVVMTAKVLRDRQSEEVEARLSPSEQAVLSEVVSIAEKVGKPVIPIVVPTNNVPYALAMTAKELGASEIFLGASAKYDPDFQLQQLALLWGTVQPDESKQICIRIFDPTYREYRAEL